jgi:hypothetical protein
MRSKTWWKAAVLSAAAAVLAAAVVGCTGSKPDDEDGGGGEGKPKGPKGGGAAALTPVKSTGTGVLKGRVTKKGNYDAQKATDELLAKINMGDSAQKMNCLGADVPDDQKVQQRWLGKGDGLQYAVVFLKPPEKQFFELSDADKKLKKDGGNIPDKVSIDQPHCAFLPHVAIAFPSYYDAATKKQKETGQEFVVTNGAKFSHNTHYAGGNPDNKEGNDTLNPGGSIKLTLKPYEKKEVTLDCKIHPWMTAYAWALDHPYAAVTDENGNFEIKDVPLGADLQVVVWHELAGTKTEPQVKFTDATTTTDFAVEPK